MIYLTAIYLCVLLGFEYTSENPVRFAAAGEKDAMIIEQRFYHNMTMKEIGKKNGYSRETARRRLKNAVKMCQNICED